MGDQRTTTQWLLLAAGSATVLASVWLVATVLGDLARQLDGVWP